MSSNKKITEIFKATAEGVNAVVGSCSFVLHGEKKQCEIFLLLRVLTHVFSSKDALNLNYWASCSIFLAVDLQSGF